MHFIPALGGATFLAGLGLIIKSKGLDEKRGILLSLLGSVLVIVGMFVMAGSVLI